MQRQKIYALRFCKNFFHFYLYSHMLLYCTQQQTQRKRRIAALGDSEARSKAKLAAAAAGNIPPDAQFAVDSPEAQSPSTECALCRGTADSEQGVCGPFVRPPLVEKSSKGEGDMPLWVHRSCLLYRLVLIDS
jgi:hypothetical protein